MIYGSVCSGIEAATVAWNSLGWKAAWFSEIEKFPSKLLSHYYPDVPNLGDMTKLSEHEHYNRTVIDLLVGGTPCQSFSIAGLRGGLDDERGNLALEFCRILLRKQPRWFVWENVPGVFSSSKGSDFAAILDGFRECGYSCAYRVLDSQHFGVPQRRRRVFVVGHLGDDWRPPAAVLFERESMRRDFTPSRKKGQIVAALTKTGVGTCGADNNQAQAGHIVATLDANYGKLQGASGQDLNHGHSHLVVYGGNNTSGPVEIAPALNAHGSGRYDFESEAIVIQPELYSIMPMNSGKDFKGRKVEVSQPIMAGGPVGGNQGGDYVLQGYTIHGTPASEVACETEISSALRARAPGGIENSTTTVIASRSIVRRLTPLECERLQGFPDGYTDIPGASDSARYASIGNSMTTHVMRWIGERIDLVDKILTPAQAD